MQVGHGSGAEPLSGRQLQHRGRQHALGCDGQEFGPARNPGGDSGRSGGGGDRLGPVSREQVQELHRLGAEPAANLDADNTDEAAPQGACQLRVALMSRAAPCSIDSAATGVGLAERPGHSRPPVGLPGTPCCQPWLLGILPLHVCVCRHSRGAHLRLNFLPSVCALALRAERVLPIGHYTRWREMARGRCSKQASPMISCGGPRKVRIALWDVPFSGLSDVLQNLN